MQGESYMLLLKTIGRRNFSKNSTAFFIPNDELTFPKSAKEACLLSNKLNTWKQQYRHLNVRNDSVKLYTVIKIKINYNYIQAVSFYNQ
jgi:hypothetical protein